MKKSIYWCIILGISFLTMLFNAPLQAQRADDNGGTSWTISTQNPVGLLESVKYNANSGKFTEVQNTEYDNTTSIYCRDSITDSRFTISRTLCNIKDNSVDYIQYVMYIGLTAATIFLIWNGFKIVTSSDREKQFGVFIKNLVYVVIGVLLLTSFYYIIDIFVSVINAIIGK